MLVNKPQRLIVCLRVKENNTYYKKIKYLLRDRTKIYKRSKHPKEFKKADTNYRLNFKINFYVYNNIRSDHRLIHRQNNFYLNNFLVKNF